jgi:L-ascorbate metabolism protein UlaG (beta-lactamase superfamily)
VRACSSIPWLTGNRLWPEGLPVERCDAILLTHAMATTRRRRRASQEHSAPATYPELAGWLGKQGATETVGFGKGGAIEIAGLRVTMTNAGTRRAHRTGTARRPGRS